MPASGAGLFCGRRLAVQRAFRNVKLPVDRLAGPAQRILMHHDQRSVINGFHNQPDTAPIHLNRLAGRA